MSLPATGQATILTPGQDNWQLLILVSGPGGVGKGTVVGELCARMKPTLQLCPSAVTRSPDERDAKGEYIYLSEEVFAVWWNSGLLLEADPHMGNWYGLARPGRDSLAISDIDVKGSIRMHQAGFPRLLRIALLPPGDTIPEMIDACVQRMKMRGSNAETIRRRRDRAEEEIELITNHWPEDPGSLVVVNDNLEKAVNECRQHIALVT